MLRLYDYLESGNGYKVRLLLHQLRIPFERVELDINRGETRTPEFLRKNPNGRIPVIEFEDGRCLSESTAIQFYFAEGTALLPENRIERAEVLQWMCFEQYSHEPYIAVLRFWVHAGMAEQKRSEIPDRREKGHQALAVMDAHLGKHRFFVAERYTIADISLYAYTHVADEGGFDLEAYPQVLAWLERVRGQPGHVGIDRG